MLNLKPRYRKILLLSGVTLAIATSTSTAAFASDSSSVDLSTTAVDTSQLNQPSVSIKLHKKTVSGYTALAKEADKHLGLRYIYGGSTPKGFDCSGFTKYVYQNSLGITLPRTAQAQYDAGIHVSEANAKKGDLVFFGSSSNRIDHVGIYLGNGRMIDSQNRGIVKENIHARWWHLVGFADVSNL